MGFHGSRFAEVSKDAIRTIELIQARKQPPIEGDPQAALGSPAGSALASVLSHLPQPSKRIESGGLIDELRGGWRSRCSMPSYIDIWTTRDLAEHIGELKERPFDLYPGADR